MNIVKRIIEKIKMYFTNRKMKLLVQENEQDNKLDSNKREILEDSKKLFSGFKIENEVLELALQYEKKKKEIEGKKNELNMINTEIISLEKRLEKLSQ